MTTNWREERDDAWADLGGHAPEELSLESKRAMARQNLGSKAMQQEVARADRHEEYAQRYNLSGIADRTPEQDIALFDLAEEAHDASDQARIDAGVDPLTVAARRHHRDERHRS